jgi:hypothetical protein
LQHPNKLLLLRPISTQLSSVNKISNEKSVAAYRVNKKLKIIFWYDHFLRGKALNRLTELECKRQKSLPEWDLAKIWFGKWEESGKNLHDDFLILPFYSLFSSCLANTYFFN